MLLRLLAILQERFRASLVTMCSPAQPTLLQRFCGTVLDVRDGEFEARLNDVSCPSNPDEVAVFFFSAVPPTEHHLVAPGAVFDWDISRQPDGRTLSTIRFRDSTWTAEDLARAKDTAKRWAWMLDG